MSLLACELFLGETPVPYVVDQSFEFPMATLEGAQEGVGGTGEASLEDAHRQTGGRAVQNARAIVIVPDVFRCFVVEFLFAFLSLRESVAQCVAVSLWI